MSDWQKADQIYVQEVYGTKFVFTLFSAKVGEGIDNWSSIAGVSNIDTSSVESTIRPVIAIYARELYRLALKEGYDGYDWDFEPTAGGQSVLQAPLWKVPKQAGIFLEELAYYFGTDAMNPARDRTANGITRDPMPTKRLLLCVDGEVHNGNFKSGVNNTVATTYVDYYVQQAYNTTSVSGARQRVDGIVTQQQDHINAGRITKEEVLRRSILTENWEAYAGTGAGIFIMAGYKHDGLDIGGFGAYRIGLNFNASDVPYKDSYEYAHLRKAIDIQYGEGPREL